MSSNNSHWFNIDKIKDSINSFGKHTNATTRHIIEKIKGTSVKNIDVSTDKSFSHARNLMAKDAPEHLSKNISVTQATQNIRKLWEGNKYASKVMKIAGSKWGRRGIWAAGIALGGLMLKGFLRPNQENVIPKKYERGYDLMSETLTDFGSPVHLNKTAQRTITPYYSSVRDNVITTTRSIVDNNIALSSNKHAIGHTRF